TCLCCLLLRRPAPPNCTLFPYTTLFRSSAELGGGTSRRPEKTERPSRSRRPAAVAETAPEAGEAPVAEAPVDALPEEPAAASERSEEHTSELQSRENLVCRLLLEKKNSV